MTDKRLNPLGIGIRYSLFATAYTPLFLLIIINQTFTQFANFEWPGWSWPGLLGLAWDYILSLFLVCIILSGFLGLWLSLHNLKKYTDSSRPYRVVEVKNKNSETISYIGTYILPFLFEDFSSLKVMISLCILLTLIYFVYINSTAILINPILNIRYSLYEVVFTGNQKRGDGSLVHRTGMLLTKHRHLQEEDILKMDRIGNQLYFGVEDDQSEKGDRRPA